MSTDNTNSPASALALATCSACVTIEFRCEECGEFEVIKSKSTLVQFCRCGNKATPIRIVNAAVRLDGRWIVHFLPNK